MKTHERTFKTMGWAGYIISFFSMGVCLAHCLSCKSATAPTGIGHPNEELLKVYVQCFADYMNLGQVEVYFTEEPYMVDTEHGRVEAAAWAIPHADYVKVYGPWLRGEMTDQISVPPPMDLEMVAAHEVCHLSGWWGEREANACAQMIYLEAGCHE